MKLERLSNLRAKIRSPNLNLVKQLLRVIHLIHLLRWRSPFGVATPTETLRIACFPGGVRRWYRKLAREKWIKLSTVA